MWSGDEPVPSEKADSLRSPSPDMPDETNQTNSPIDDVMWFSDEELDGAKVTDSDDEPSLHTLDDGMTVLVHVKDNKQLLLPGKYEWAIRDGKKHGEAILQCTTGTFKDRMVKHALSSSKTTEIGVEIPADKAVDLSPPKVKRPALTLKIAAATPLPKVGDLKIAAATPLTKVANAKEPEQEAAGTPAPGTGASSSAKPEVAESEGEKPDETPIMDGMDET
eukprot:s1084_g12.t1